jgi:hypothetical protein
VPSDEAKITLRSSAVIGAALVVDIKAPIKIYKIKLQGDYALENPTFFLHSCFTKGNS